jgi:hypothetical protein
MTMKQARSSDALVRLFDPRGGGPVLFISGWVILALLGNGIYSLVLHVFGQSLWTYVAIIVIALLIFVFVIQPRFWNLLRRRQPDPITIVPPEQRAEPHVGLILSVGPSPRAADREIIAWHLQHQTLRHCWMIVDPDVEKSQKVRDLQYWLVEQNVQPHILRVQDASQADLSYKAVKAGVDEARRLIGDQPLIVDITGGLKPMTAGTVLACLDNGIPMQYLAAKRDPTTGDPDRVVSLPMKVELRQAFQEPVV